MTILSDLDFCKTMNFERPDLVQDKALILISTPTCAICKGLVQPESLKTLETALGDAPLFKYEFSGNDPDASACLAYWHVQSVPVFFIVDYMNKTCTVTKQIKNIADAQGAIQLLTSGQYLKGVHHD